MFNAQPTGTVISRRAGVCVHAGVCVCACGCVCACVYVCVYICVHIKEVLTFLPYRH